MARTVPIVPTDTASERRVISVTDSLRFTIPKGTEGTLETSQSGRQFVISGGEGHGTVPNIASSGHDQLLMLRRFARTEDEAVVQVIVAGPARPAGFLAQLLAAGVEGSPSVADVAGRIYPSVGYVAAGAGRQYFVRYTRTRPLQHLSDAPSEEASSLGCALLFIVPAGAEVSEFRVGAQPVERYSPAIRCVQEAEPDRR